MTEFGRISVAKKSISKQRTLSPGVDSRPSHFLVSFEIELRKCLLCEARCPWIYWQIGFIILAAPVG